MSSEKQNQSRNKDITLYVVLGAWAVKGSKEDKRLYLIDPTEVQDEEIADRAEYCNVASTREAACGYCAMQERTLKSIAEAEIKLGKVSGSIDWNNAEPMVQIYRYRVSPNALDEDYVKYRKNHPEGIPYKRLEDWNNTERPSADAEEMLSLISGLDSKAQNGIPVGVNQEAITELAAVLENFEHPSEITYNLSYAKPRKLSTYERDNFIWVVQNKDSRKWMYDRACEKLEEIYGKDFVRGILNDNNEGNSRDNNGKKQSLLCRSKAGFLGQKQTYIHERKRRM